MFLGWTPLTRTSVLRSRGKTMAHVRVVERDYANLYNKFISFGPKAREDGVAAVGVQIPIKNSCDQMLKIPLCRCLTRARCVGG